ncbi:MAG: tetratricopeptide repeat protein [candidate division Zixibacteria bacterium]|nr:tetratricopeptide repeat protein [candidate division Zixibacteria bacterium]
MSIKLFTRLIFFLLALAVSVSADSTHKALSLEIRFVEKLSGGSVSETVICDTLYLPREVNLQAFCGNLSFDLKYTGLVDSQAQVEINRFSLPPDGGARLMKLSSPLNVPYIEDSILIKNSSVYQVFYTPLKEIEFESGCEYNHNIEDDFYPDPSTNYEIYFVPNSLGDIHWNRIRDFYEAELKRFKSFLEFKQPGKTSLFLYPCSSYHYAPYKNSEFGIHPARSMVFHEYSHKSGEIAAPASIMSRLYRFWGYAPRMIVEGCANLSDFHLFYARDYKLKSGLYEIEDMLQTRSYDNLDDPHKKRQLAASFMFYLLLTENASTIRAIYRDATDLTAVNVIEQKTGKALADITEGWHEYIDTVTLESKWFVHFAEREMLQRHVYQAEYLLEKGLEYFPEDDDLMLNLFGVYFHMGRYLEAAGVLEKDNLSETNRLNLVSNMYLAGGKSDRAEKYYRQAVQNPASDYLHEYKLGLIEFYDDNFEQAKKHLKKAIDSTTSASIRVDSRLHLGRILLSERDRESADSQFVMAYNYSRSMLKNNPDDPLANLRAGQALMYQKDIENAKTYLSLAEFVEFRPFYLGQIYLSLGHLYDLSGERGQAEKYYKRVDEINASAVDQAEARKYLSKPFEL